jgi:ubiquinone/menaquinone biosynthesis C-methylase UbiE
MVKNLASELTPPILMRGLAAMRRWIRGESPDDEPPGVRGAEWYNQAYEHVPNYNQHYTKSRYYFVWTVIADRILRAGAQKVIDLGCGSGQFALLLHDKHLREYYGLDFSSKSIEMAKQRCPFYRFDVVDLAQSNILDKESYDCVVSLEFLEHVEFDLELIGRIKRGTKFFGMVPNFPYTSHVRHFTNEAEVQARYGHLFSDCRVDQFLENLELIFFLIEGVKC